MSEKKVQSGRITKPQKIKLLELMKTNRRIACGQFSGPDSHKQMTAFWQGVGTELNACGGAKKTVEQWKKSWTDWKGSVKKQYSALKRFRSSTGNRPASEGPKELDALDTEVLEFFPQEMVEGDGGTIEMGLPSQNELQSPELYCDVEFLMDTSYDDHLRRNLMVPAAKSTPHPTPPTPTATTTITAPTTTITTTITAPTTTITAPTTATTIITTTTITTTTITAPTTTTATAPPKPSRQPSYFSVLEEVQREGRAQHQVQLDVLQAILQSVRNIERHLCGGVNTTHE